MTCDLYDCDYDITDILSLWLKRTTHKAFFDFTEIISALGRSFTETSNQRTSCWSLDIDLNWKSWDVDVVVGQLTHQFDHI